MPEARTSSATVVFARFFWMLIGPLFLGLALYYIATSSTGWQAPADFAYFAILAGLILGRWIDFRGGDPRTSTGEPASSGDLGRYIRVTLIAGVVVWVLAHILRDYVLAR